MQYDSTYSAIVHSDQVRKARYQARLQDEVRVINVTGVGHENLIHTLLDFIEEVGYGDVVDVVHEMREMGY